MILEVSRVIKGASRVIGRASRCRPVTRVTGAGTRVTGAGTRVIEGGTRVPGGAVRVAGESTSVLDRGVEMEKGPGRRFRLYRGLSQIKFGGVLLSHNPSVAVPSALSGLASGFGMGPGVSLTL